MALDIRGSLKNTRVNGNAYVVFEELLSNSIDSYLIRKNIEPALENLAVKILVEFFNENLDGSQVVFKITCVDNGSGFGNEQVKAFVTKDTSYKDDLNIEGIGKCKGSGRIQFLHYFSKLKIDSRYKTESGFARRLLDIDSSTKEINEDSFRVESVDDAEISTTLVLDVIKPDAYERFFKARNTREDFCASVLKNHLLVNFLQRFVSLQSRLGDFSIELKSTYQNQSDEALLSKADIPTMTSQKEVTIHHIDANGSKTLDTESFRISHYKLDKGSYRLRCNLVALCAKSSTVKIITSRYLKSKSLENHDINGFYHIVLIESDFLDERVNEHRDDFEIVSDLQHGDWYLKKEISWDQIYAAFDDIIEEMLTPPDWDKEKIVKAVGKKYGISPAMIADAKVRIHYADTEEKVVERVLASYQEQIIKDTSAIFDIKEEISKTDPTSLEFRQKVNELAWKFTSSLKSMDMANLSQLVVRRAAILEILSLAIAKSLMIQTENVAKKFDEKIIHNIFFPMGKDSNEISDHDIWLLNEEYQYFDYITSDKQLSKIKWDESNMLFESDVDQEMQIILKKNLADNSAKRPDVAIFNKEGSAIIIEFKAPDVNLDEHTSDLMEYAQLLAAKSGGKLKKFYGYLIGNSLNPNRIRGYTRFPSGRGWFGTEAIVEHSSGKTLGELYSEILFYDDIADRANKRLDVYKQRLNIDLSKRS